ncbi:microsomal signal peptidase 12 kDa subunit, partial [Testicularia cyperi]
KQDFQGQRLADRIMQELLVLGAAIAFLVGYFRQDLYLCMLLYGAVFVATALISVPPWPMYNKHHVEWLPNL